MEAEGMEDHDGLFDIVMAFIEGYPEKALDKLREEVKKLTAA